MTSHFVLAFVIGVAASFAITLVAAAAWLRSAAHPAPAQHIASWLARIDEQADFFFAAESQGQMVRHAACERSTPVGEAAPRRARDRRREKRSPPQSNLARLPATQVKAALDGVLD